MSSAKATLLLLVGAYLVAVGASICGNSFFAGTSAAIIGVGPQATSGTTQNSTLYMFLKPSDRVTFAGASAQNDGTWNVTLLGADGKAVSSWSGEGRLFQIVSVPERGVYLLEVERTAVSDNSSVTETATVLSGRPSDYLSEGALTTSVGLGLVAVWFPYSRRREDVRPGPTAEPPEGAAGRGRLREFTVLLRRELIGDRLILLSAPILFILMYSAGAFMPNTITASPGSHISDFSDLLVPSLTPYKDWLNVFPIVVVAATYTFAFQRETRVLRSLLLNPVREASLFAAKLVAILVVVLLPIEACIAITFFLFQPGLAISDPTTVFGNLLPWSVVYLLYGAVMVGFAVLPAVAFRKSIYAFIVPLFVVFAILTEGFGLSGYAPWTVWAVWANPGTGALSYLTFGNGFDYSAFFHSVLPNLAAASLLGAAAFLVFTRQDRE